MKYRLTTAAELEFAEAAAYLLDDSPQAAVGFVEEITSAINEIAAHPDRHPIYHGVIRVRRITTYHYSIFYDVLTDYVLILSISHDAREPEHWQFRT